MKELGMGRKPCCSKEGLKKGSWTKKEDLLLTEYIKEYGEGTGWRSLPKKAGNHLKKSKKKFREKLIENILSIF